MPLKIISTLVAVALTLAYLVPLVVKLKQVSLGIVMLIGVTLMLVDLWDTLKERDS
jgi:hypothetical protein